jgi:hypothetical protein
MIQTREFKTWSELKEYLTGFSSLDYTSKERFLFRGQSDSRWALQPTLDRSGVSGRSSQNREDLASSLQLQFEREAQGLGVPRDLSARQREMLARHHGLPSPLLDWTRTPYVAAYFAFDDVVRDVSRQSVAIWILDRTKLVEKDDKDILVLDQDLIDSVRVVEQEAAFVRIGGNVSSMESVASHALYRFDIAASQRSVALKDLGTMRITARTLFRDLDGAARSAARRLSLG